MTFRHGVIVGTIITALIAGMAGSIWWLTTRATGKRAGSSSEAPAKVAHPLKEEQINTITLNSDALKLQFGRVESRRMTRSRMFAGEAMIPTGRSIVVQAPMNGLLRPAPAGFPLPGQSVKAGQTVLLFHPLLTPEGRVTLAASKIDADAQADAAQTQFNGAKVARDRAQKVFEGEAGSRRALDEAQVQFDLAQRNLQAALARRDMINKLMGEMDKSTSGPIPLDSPTSGILRTVSAIPGQSVPAGAALFEVIDTQQLWIKVPIYAGEFAEVDVESPANVGRLASRPSAQRRATAAVAPPSANAATGTVDLYYDFDNLEMKLRPGERVSVQAPLKGAEFSLTVPWSAVVYDIHGGAWVYEQTSGNTYVRKRVVVRAVLGKTAVLASGPADGARVVTAGAQELFGTETGFTK